MEENEAIKRSTDSDGTSAVAYTGARKGLTLSVEVQLDARHGYMYPTMMPAIAKNEEQGQSSPVTV